MNAMIPHVWHVILDRDGVLNIERSDGGAISDWSQWQWIPGARKALAMLRHSGVQVSVATNQSGVGRGTVTRAEVDIVHARMLEEAAQAGGAIDRVLVCPHAPDDGCTCRKPLPGLILQAIQASGVPRNSTVVVGDDLRDLHAAWAVDVPAILLRTGKGRTAERLIPVGSAEIFDDLHAFVAAEFSNPVSRAARIS